MSVQKITDLSVSSAIRKQNKKNDINKKLSVSSERNETSLKKSDAIKNNFLSGISFKGYTKTVSGGGTSGELINPWQISKPSHTSVVRGRKGYDSRENYHATASVYFADPGEEITDEIKDKHMYIVEYDVFDDVSDEEIEDAIKSSELMQMVSDLGDLTKILQLKNKSKVKEIEEANSEVEQAKAVYNSALTNRETKIKEKEALDLKLSEVINKAERAKEKYNILKKEEEAEFLRMAKIEKLMEISSQLEDIDKSDESIDRIKAQIQEYIAGLSNKKG